MVFLNVKTGNTYSNQYIANLMRLCEMQLLFGVGLCVGRMGFGAVKLKGFG